MRICSLFVLLIGITGCAVLNQPVIEIDVSHLTCESNPEFVDGNLETEGTFAVNGFIRKAYHMFGGESRRLAYSQRRYITQVEGNRRTEAIIKLDTPTYITYVEVYPASRVIPNFAMMTTTDDPPRFDVAFERVSDKQHKDIEGLTPVRYRIEREVLYLRMSADGIEDKQNSARTINSGVEIPLKGASIREIKFYGRQTP
ncbi:MAG: hypothetical protein OXU27_13880 [Candidatus Poribacteria bacterium]|nr:hypothetical protein [Candidatus Poribacteria bacterium]MDE0326657.1 hypothetical protein [Candidatus Poribacteria bacterium]